MTQKSLVYVMLAVAVGYILVSAVPQQVAMYTNPPPLLGRDSAFNQTEGADSSILGSPESSEGSDLKVLGESNQSFIEVSRLPDLMKWWTIDIMVALTVYWVARRRLS